MMNGMSESWGNLQRICQNTLKEIQCDMDMKSSRTASIEKDFENEISYFLAYFLATIKTTKEMVTSAFTVDTINGKV